MNNQPNNWRNKTIQGSVFPDSPIVNNLPIHFTKEMREEYIPLIAKMGLRKGVLLLCTIMANIEGFRAGTRSYKTNNPGNIGNTDNGSNVPLATLADGINRQVIYLNKIINGQSKAYPMGKHVVIAPYFSDEIFRNAKLYGLYPYTGSPGYEFDFTGRLDQFIKIYSTGARSNNSYLSQILSYFKLNGIDLKPETTLQDIAAMQ